MATTLSKDNAIAAGYQLVRGAAASSSTYLALLQAYATNGEAAIVAQIQGTTAGLTNAQLASLVVTNAGISNRPDLVQYVADLFGIYGAANRGQVVLNLAERLLSFTNDANYGAAARAFSGTVASNLAYSQSANAPSDRAGVTGGATNSFTLTAALGENIVGTGGADTISAVVGTDGTFNIGDQVDGGAGVDTLNLLVIAGATGIPAGAAVRNVEIVNVTYATTGTDTGVLAAAGTTLNSTSFTGVQQLWQIDNIADGSTFADVTVAADVTAGFRSTAGAVSVINSVTGTQASVNVALDGVGSSSTIVFGGATVKTINVSGTIAGANALTLTNAGTTAETINLGFTSALNLAVGDAFGATLKVIDASTSTGAITAGINTASGHLVNLTSVKTGSGNDAVTLTAGTTKALAVDLGAGNDTVTLTGVASGLISVALGAGKDTLAFSNTTTTLTGYTAGADNTPAAQAQLTAHIITVTDFKTSEDLLNLSGAGSLGGVALSTTQLAAVNTAGSLAQATAAVATTIGVNHSAVFSYGGDAYVLINNTTAALDASDALIKLVGVDATQFTTGQNANLVLGTQVA